MAFSLSQAVEEIKSRVDIVNVIGEYVRLKKAGRNYVGLCPFHSEKTPSFTVSPERQMFYCFGCHEGGDVFTFLMKRENMSFAEAVEVLAGRLGIKVERSQQERSRADERELLFALLERAQAHFSRNFNQAAGKVIAYVEKRGVTREVARRFGLGYSLPEWEAFYSEERRLGTPKELLLSSGLVVQNDSGGIYDRFRDKLMFPIFDLRGRVIGFGARSLDGSEPKYINSPESPIFKKGNALYGMNLAHVQIREVGVAILVEGYMDVIACHQFGFANAVATLGTALTQAQARTLAAMAEKVVIAYDADNAGLAATLRGAEVFSELGCELAVAEIPKGKDPDEFIRAYGADAFRDVIEHALPYIEFRFKLACAGKDLSQPEGRLAAANEVKKILVGVENVVERELYARSFSERLGIPQGLLSLEVARSLRHKKPLRSNNSAEQSITKLDEKTTTLYRAEKTLVELLIQRPDLAPGIKEKLGGIVFENAIFRKIAEKIFELVETGQYKSVSQVMEYADDQMAKCISELAITGIQHGDPEIIVADCINRVKRSKAARLLVKIKQTGNVSEKRQLLDEYYSLIKQVKADMGAQGGGVSGGN
ncbi:MAG TPA: DNA primase [Firmicutes bacterium]|nr:DNA primase [Bacillota bacterium]